MNIQGFHAAGELLYVNCEGIHGTRFANLIGYNNDARKEPVMPIVRLILRNRESGSGCSSGKCLEDPMRIQQPGCLSGKMLKCIDDPGEYISYAEWESQEQIDAYRKSEPHEQIKDHTRKLRGERAVVKRYEVSS